MLVWCSLAAASASRRKRGTALGLSPRPPLRTLSATLRLSDSWRASKTTPMPPRPTSRTISKSPSRCCAGGWSSDEDIRLAPAAGPVASSFWANDKGKLPGRLQRRHVSESRDAGARSTSSAGYLTILVAPADDRNPGRDCSIDDGDQRINHFDELRPLYHLEHIP